MTFGFAMKRNYPKSFTRLPTMAAGLFCLIVIGLLTAHTWGYFHLSADSTWAQLLDVNQEKNFATGFSVFLLLACAVLLSAIAGITWRYRFSLHWIALSLIFAVMAGDEWYLAHEKLNTYLDDQFQTSGLFYYDWVVPGLIFVALTALAYARFLSHLPRRTRLWIFYSGLLYVSGVLGMEMISGYYIDHNGLGDRGMLSLLNAIEETAEMMGLIGFSYALMRYLRRQIKGPVKSAVRG